MSFNLIKYFILVVPFFDQNVRFVYFRARGACARLFFPAPYFFVFCSPNCWNPSLVFLWIALKTVSRLIKSEKRRPLSLQKKKSKTNKQTSAQSTKQRSARVKFVKKYKSLTVERGRYDNLLWWIAKIYLFSCLIQKVVLSGSGSTSSTRYMPYRTPCRGMPDTSLTRC